MEKPPIKILVNFTNNLYCEAFRSLLTTDVTSSESQQYIVECIPPGEKFIPDIVLVDCDE